MDDDKHKTTSRLICKCVESLVEKEQAKFLLLEFWKEHEVIEGDDATGEPESVNEIQENRFLFLLQVGRLLPGLLS